MLPRQANVSLLYNGANASGQIAPYLASFQYTDVASGSSDKISIQINDRDHRWIGAWFPQKGDLLQPTIQTFNWWGDGQNSRFPCGTFRVDDFSFAGGPIRLSLDAVAVPADNSGFKATKRTETYEKTTLQEIGQAIADRSGISLFFDASDIAIQKVEQNNQNDCEFYCGLVEKFGLALKIYNSRIVVFSEGTYEAKKAKAILTPADFEPGWSWNTQTTGTYTGVKYQYTNSDKNKTFTVTAGGGDRILECNEPADNLTEATAIALAALNKANRGMTTMSITMILPFTRCLSPNSAGLRKMLWTSAFRSSLKVGVSKAAASFALSSEFYRPDRPRSAHRLRQYREVRVPPLLFWPVPMRGDRRHAIWPSRSPPRQIPASGCPRGECPPARSGGIRPG